MTPRALPARTQVQVWQDGQVTVLHGVAIESDSLSGVAFTEAPTCDSCRVRMALLPVDSLRLGSKERGFIRSLGVAFLVVLAFAYYARGLGGT